MPLPFFRQPEQPKLYMDVIPAARSTDSTVDVTRESKSVPTVQLEVRPRSTSPTLSNPFRKTSPATPQGSWRTKDPVMAAVFRDERESAPPNLECLWSIQRCEAFDDEESSDED